MHSIELLQTVKHVVSELSSEDLLESYSQLFWVSLALLTSVLEWEYFAGLEILDLIIKKIDTNEHSVINTMMSTLPSKWPGGFAGLFIPVSRGLCSSKTENLSLSIINSLLFVSVPNFLDIRIARYLLVTLANLPVLLQVYDYELDNLFETGHSVIESCFMLAKTLAEACSNGDSELLSRLLFSFASRKMRRRDDFLKQLSAIIKNQYEILEGQIIKFCMTMLTNSNPAYPSCMLRLLECLFTDNSKRAMPLGLPVESNSAWVRPLMALLDTDHGSQAAHLLDTILGGRAKSSEVEMIGNVGGAQNIYGYVRKSRADTPEFLLSGWLVEGFEGEGSLLAKRRIATAARSCQHMPAPKRRQARIEMDPQVAREMLTKFSDLEKHFRSVAAA